MHKPTQFSSRFATQTIVPLIQTLESRRLMSFTAGVSVPVVVAPVAESHAPVQIHMDHAFGFQKELASEQWDSAQLNSAQLNSAQLNIAQTAISQPEIALTGVNFSLQLFSGTNAGLHQFADDNEAIDAQFARAIALVLGQGTPIVTAPASVAAESTVTTTAVASEQSGAATMSLLYSTIGTSTVSAIDNADVASANHGDTLHDIVVAQTGTDTSSPNVTRATPQNVAAGILLASMANNTSPNDSTQVFDLKLLEDHSAASTPPHLFDALPPAESSALLSRSMLQSIELELLAVKAYSQDLALNIGRARAIELSHAETMDGVVLERPGSWKASATVIGAAIASVIYAEKELVRGKKNVGTVFSNRQLRHSPTLC